ncbi:hypothetical protein AYR62_13595 [Secundilactobacillus paracollinoides]|uniref:DUF5776 domain-containing protein n=1 Tax=Secundilactobacillus paracollinoides TaxID=240427 RepID=A0A1B2IWS3_9LACO|nr:DUF5776 domain-containing protein [Secundilactobacillus paracollinoides]ANZ60636.1 hypothetical protein AYR61_04290 [Secundilactobacillus paracollinoides]ANZ65009.1 hypothetical protein AYR62_13595 [Secundilactobacillus paracollinoides]ANZ66479.1 hypothetical protein AYR63_04575 [Secundilactobacillus paracollinoides]
MGKETMTPIKHKKQLVLGLAAITFGFVFSGIGGSAKADQSTQANFVNSGSTFTDTANNLQWTSHLADATNSSDVSLNGGYDYQNRSAVNVKNGPTNLMYDLSIKNTASVAVSGVFQLDMNEADDSNGYKGAIVRYGSADHTKGFDGISNYVTSSTGISDLTQTFGLPSDSLTDYPTVGYARTLDSLTAADKEDVARTQLKFTAQPGATLDISFPVNATAGANLIQADEVATAPIEDFTTIIGSMTNNQAGTSTPMANDNSFNHDLSLAAYNITAITTKQNNATVQVGDTINAATFGADPTDAKIGTVTDANGNTVTNPTAQAGTYKVQLTRAGYLPTTVTLTVNNAPANNGGGSSSTTTGTSTSTGTTTGTSDVTTSTSPDTVVSGQTVANKGRAIYAMKGLYMYKKATFTTSGREYHYAKQVRTKRPMFIVDGYAKSSNGTLRYRVHDYYKKSRKGYITANSSYTRLAYYFSIPKSKAVSVITAGGVNSYKNSSLSGKTVKHYKKGTVLKVKKVVKYKLASRFELTNGRYVSGNKRFVMFK